MTDRTPRVSSSRKIEHHPNRVARDLGIKFNDDLRALIERSLDVMALDLNAREVASLLLSSLAASGLAVQNSLHCPQGSFLTIAKGAEAYWRAGRENEL